MERKIVSVRNYGRVVLHLRERMEEQGLNRNEVADAVNTRFEVIDKWYSGDVSRLDMDVLARLCYVLDCGTEDLITYETD